jgi:hypothetical protein
MSDLRRFIPPAAADSRQGDLNREAYDPIRRPFMLPLANTLSELLPGLGIPCPSMAGTERTYAPWPVWKGSTTKPVKFWPWLTKKQAGKLFAQAQSFERQTRQKGKQDGALGRNGLLVLHSLLFNFLNYVSGRLDPAIETIAKRACISISSAKRGLASLKRCGVLHWVNRAGETRDDKGRFCEEQDTNAYGIIPPTQWLGFLDPLPDAPPPEPTEWGAVPPLPSVTEQAADELAAQPGATRTALAILETDPGDEQAAALASFGRTTQAMPEKADRKPASAPVAPPVTRPTTPPALPVSTVSGWNSPALLEEARQFGLRIRALAAEEQKTSLSTDSSD